ncbi:MAG: DUF1284 domain-containing protein [Candidatus Omnitrophica bacterium]|nr:DUF1284 domain-containing protein [Candidatus Omnitrophota bacterium]
MRLRAHHLLCLQGFQGYGYNPNFTNNLTKLIQEINSTPQLEIELIDEGDAVCFFCPYHKESLCQKTADSSRKVKDIDLKVLNKLGLSKGARVKQEDIFCFVNKKFRYISDVKDICTDCEWKEKCLWFIKLK